MEMSAENRAHFLIMFLRGHDQGRIAGRGGGLPSFGDEFDPLTTQKIPPLLLFYEIHFWLTGLKIVPTAYLAPIYTNFVVKIFQEVPKKDVFLFKNLTGTQNVLSICGLHYNLDCSRNQLGQPIKS